MEDSGLEIWKSVNFSRVHSDGEHEVHGIKLQCSTELHTSPHYQDRTGES